MFIGDIHDLVTGWTGQVDVRCGIRIVMDVDVANMTEHVNRTQIGQGVYRLRITACK